MSWRVQGFSLVLCSNRSAPLFGRGHNDILSESLWDKVNSFKVFLWSLPLLCLLPRGSLPLLLGSSSPSDAVRKVEGPL